MPRPRTSDKQKAEALAVARGVDIPTLVHRIAERDRKIKVYESSFKRSEDTPLEKYSCSRRTETQCPTVRQLELSKRINEELKESVSEYVQLGEKWEDQHKKLQKEYDVVHRQTKEGIQEEIKALEEKLKKLKIDADRYGRVVVRIHKALKRKELLIRKLRERSLKSQIEPAFPAFSALWAMNVDKSEDAIEQIKLENEEYRLKLVAKVAKIGGKKLNKKYHNKYQDWSIEQLEILLEMLNGSIDAEALKVPEEKS